MHTLVCSSVDQRAMLDVHSHATAIGKVFAEEVFAEKFAAGGC